MANAVNPLYIPRIPSSCNVRLKQCKGPAYLMGIIPGNFD